ncbi:MAG: DUF3662 domain-containing protein [Anaerolineae bacterium]|nr:DUF3662 domain-containing protein [Anaerolineae bacterium]
MRLESWIEQLVEEPFVRFFAGRLLPQEVAKHLVLALEDGERIGADGTTEVPGRYRIALNPDDLTALKRHHPDLESLLASALITIASRMHFRLQEPPNIILKSEPALPLRAIRIAPADRTPPPTQPTRDMDFERLKSLIGYEDEHKTRAYLIIQGDWTFDLTQPIIHIGRALDNDLIIEDRRVSRYHAQLRRRYGRYILQDLGSSGGTSVNGFPVQESVLRSGDLISLAGVDLIYAEQDTTRRKRPGDTQPFTAKSDS